MEGSIGFGLGSALWSEITVVDGRVEQSNFHDFRILRIDEMPRVEVHIVPSAAPPTGVGEPGVPPIAPAVANAFLALTGRSVRRLRSPGSPTARGRPEHAFRGGGALRACRLVAAAVGRAQLEASAPAPARAQGRRALRVPTHSPPSPIVARRSSALFTGSRQGLPASALPELPLRARPAAQSEGRPPSAAVRGGADGDGRAGPSAAPPATVRRNYDAAGMPGWPTASGSRSDELARPARPDAAPSSGSRQATEPAVRDVIKTWQRTRFVALGWAPGCGTPAGPGTTRPSSLLRAWA
jgi:hypothetical protein